MLIHEMFRHVEAVVGKPMTIHGLLVVTGDKEAFLTSSPNASIAKRRLYIRDDGRIARHLLLTLPVYCGGPFIYIEECVLVGTIEQGTNTLEMRRPPTMLGTTG